MGEATTRGDAKRTYPLSYISLDEAKALQFRMVDLFHRHLGGRQALQAGDYGFVPELGRSQTTAVVETMLAEVFDAEDAVLVRGAGTGSIRCALMANLKPGSRVVVHDAPLYATTDVTFRAMGIQKVIVDFNTRGGLAEVLSQGVDCVYIQHSRQLLADRYDLEVLIADVRGRAPGVFVLTDDNYTVFSAPRIGCQVGAGLSTFSVFKVLGEVGVGCVVGKRRYIDPIRADNYSGGSKVQGPEALISYKRMVYAPVAQAVQAGVVNEVVARLNTGEVEGVTRALAGSHQEPNILVELDDSLDPQAVLEAAWRCGAVPWPVGANSQYEVGALFYRLSGVMRQAEPELAQHMIRIGSFRAGPDTIVRILKEAIGNVRDGSGRKPEG